MRFRLFALLAVALAPSLSWADSDAADSDVDPDIYTQRWATFDGTDKERRDTLLADTQALQAGKRKLKPTADQLDTVNDKKDELKSITAEQDFFKSTQMQQALKTLRKKGILDKDSDGSAVADLASGPAMQSAISDAYKSGQMQFVKIKVDGTPFDLNVEVEKASDNSVKFKYRLALAIGDPNDTPPTESRVDKALLARFQKMHIDADTLNSYVKKDLSENMVTDTAFTVDVVAKKDAGGAVTGADLKDPADTKKKLAETAKKYLTKDKADRYVGDDAIKDLNEKINGQAEAKRNEITDASEDQTNSDKGKELNTKLKVAQLYKSGKAPSTDDVCTIWKAAGVLWNDFSKSQKETCKDADPNNAKVAAAKKEDEDKKVVAEKQNEATEANSTVVDALQQCVAFLQNQLAQTGTKAVVDMVGPVYAELMKLGFSGSELFNLMIKPDKNSIINVPGMPNVPMMGEDPNLKAAQVASTVTGAGAGKKLADERAAAVSIMKNFGYYVEILKANSPDPMALMNDPRYQTLVKFRDDAIALIPAIDAQVALLQGNAQSQLHGINTTDGSGASTNVGVMGAGGSNTPAATTTPVVGSPNRMPVAPSRVNRKGSVF